MFYDRMLRERDRLDRNIKELQSKLKHFPEGKLFCTKNHQYFKWYLTDGNSQTYLPKSQRKLAEKLATKKYLSLLLEDFLHEKRALEYYLRHHNPHGSRSSQLLTNCPEYQTLLTSCFTPLSKELQEWANQPFESNPNYPEQLIHKTLSGKLVRSKSEAVIDMLLFQHQIPFRYESPLQLDNTTIYPDFTIRHPETGETYYWEHFGRADDPEYYKKIPPKLNRYFSNGIIPSIQLITTYEAKDYPLSIEHIEKTIEYYFL